MLPISELRQKPGHLLWRAQQLGWQLFADEAGQLNITPVQETVLLALRKRPNIDLKTLGELVALDRSTAADVFTRLEQRGLVIRVPHSRDKRAWSLSLSTSGGTLADALIPISRKAASRLLSPLTVREREELLRILRKVVGLADQVDFQESSNLQPNRMRGQSFILIGSGSLNSNLSTRLRTEGALVTQMQHEGDGSRVFEKHLKSRRGVNKPRAIIIAGGDRIRSPTSLDDYGYIKQELDARSSIFNSIVKAYPENDHLRVISIGLFPLARLDDGLSNSAIAINSTLVAMIQRHQVVASFSGIVLTSITPRIISPSQKSHKSVAMSLATVAEADIVSCVCFLVSNEARAIAATTIELGGGV